jgi:hypothetical protein
MERLFSPCTRLYDMLESQGRLAELRHLSGRLRELNLDVSTDELLSSESAFTYADLYAMLANENMVVWLTPHAAVVPNSGRGIHLHPWMLMIEPCLVCFSADGKDIVALARSHEPLLEICDVVLRLMAASVVHSVRLNNWDSRLTAINAPTLAHLMEQCQSLKAITLQRFAFDENHIHVLGAYSRPGLEIHLKYCQITGAAAEALVEILGRRNSRLNSLSLCPEDDNQQVLAISGALRENRGLIELNLPNRLRLSDEAWDAVCDSLKTHPTLQVLDLSSALRAPLMTQAVITSRIHALLDMMKMNMSIHTIHLDSSYSEHELFRQSVTPYLETNQLRARIHVIQKARPIPYRVKVLGRALLSTRADPNKFWMLLSGNSEVLLPSRTTAIAAAASLLPTSITAAASPTENVTAATVATSTMSTLMTTSTDSLPTAVAADATSTTTPSTTSPSDPTAY